MSKQLVTNTQTQSNCRSCARLTRHEVLFSFDDQGDEYYQEVDRWQVLQCRGCDTLGFRHQNEDHENLQQDWEGSLEPTVVIRCYPHAIPEHKLLSHINAVPALIQNVYKQSVAAYAAGSSIIAGMGLRTTIEAVCNHLEISGASLEKRIDALLKNGHISSSDKKRLHGIRFLGNDAAHNIRNPPATELRVALEIIEHLINSVFILEMRAKGLLDTTIETFEDLLPVLESCARATEASGSQTLANILGKNRRRLGADFSLLEVQVIEKIKQGSLKFLTIAPLQEVDGKPVQTYDLVAAELIEENDFPF